ncbi:hypothetical protein [Streptomyces klenkii]
MRHTRRLVLLTAALTTWAFASWSDNLVPDDTNETGDIFVRDVP